MKRKKGFYWVLPKNDNGTNDSPKEKGWSIAYWDGGRWLVIGRYGGFDDKDFHEIHDQKIK